MFDRMKKMFDNFRKSDFISTFKEELTIGPILLVLFYIFNSILIAFLPQGAYFDFFSEMETIFSKILLFFIAVWTAHLSLRVFFPQIYKTLHESIYHNWFLLPTDKKIEYAIKFILTLILTAGLVFGARGQTPTNEIRNKLIKSINEQLVVREVGGNNLGPEVETYLKTVGAKPKDPWCGAFVGTNLHWVGVKNPMSARAADYAKPKDIIWQYKHKNNIEPLPGDVPSYYYPNLGRVAHVGFFEKKDKSGYFITVEGNTDSGNFIKIVRDGGGVHKFKRDPSKIHAISRFIDTPKS